MEYWRGWMNWPLKQGWVCEICGKYEGMTWGLTNGECRCNNCHAPYYMKNAGGEIVDVPNLEMKVEYIGPAKRGFPVLNSPIDEWSDEQWADLMQKKPATVSMED